MNAAKDQAIILSNQAAHLGQNIAGSGNISSGSGNVTVENINIYAAGTTPPPKEKIYQKSHNKLGTLFGVPNLPPNHLERPEYLEEFRAALLSGRTQAVGITGKVQYVGVQGMGGLGKSVLAAALAHDEAVRAAFPDGIFWLRFRQDIDHADLLELQAEILKILAPDQLPDSLANGVNLLNRALEYRSCLFIADDLWDSDHIRNFIFKSKDCRFLLTTRNIKVIEETGAHHCELGLLSEKQAQDLLTACSGCAENALPDASAAILRKCGQLPLAVAAIGSMVKGKPANRWEIALERLQNARLDKIPAKVDINCSYENLLNVFQVSMDDLPPEVQAYYKTLIIFSEDERIPESVLQIYWEYCRQGDYEPLDAVDLLVEKSLLSRSYDDSLILHDLLRDYLTNQSGGNAEKLHKQLFDAYKAAYPDGWHTIPYKRHEYFYKKWTVHAKLSDDSALSAAIADDFIRHQPLLDFNSLWRALEFADYDFHDIAHHLLEESEDYNVVTTCLDFLHKQESKKCAQRVLQKNEVYRLEERWLRLLGEEDAHYSDYYIRLLKEKGNDPWKVKKYLDLLGSQGRKYAWQLLKARENINIIIGCCEFLGDEARKEVKCLLMESNNLHIIKFCIEFLDKDVKKEGRIFLNKGDHGDIMTSWLKQLKCEAEDGDDEAQHMLTLSEQELFYLYCMIFLDGQEEKTAALKLIKISRDDFVKCECFDILAKQKNTMHLLDDKEKEFARRVLKKPVDSKVLLYCLEFLGNEAHDDAKRILKENKSSEVRNVCLQILGDDGQRYARQLLREADDSRDQIYFLEFFGDKAKEDARRILKESKDSKVLNICLQILGNEGQRYACHMLQENNDSNTIIAFLESIRDEDYVKEYAKHLLKQAKDGDIFELCLDILEDEFKDEARIFFKSGRVGNTMNIYFELYEKMAFEHRRNIDDDKLWILSLDKNDFLLMFCIDILKEEAKSIVAQLANTAQNKRIRIECQKMLIEWQKGKFY